MDLENKNLSKIKVIQIAHASHSYFTENKQNKEEIRKILLNDWYAKLGIQLKKLYPKIDVECWAPEKLNRDEEVFSVEGVKFRIFPVTFSPCYALDFSIPMLKELKKEIKNAKEKRKKLIIHFHEYHNLHSLLIASLFGKQKIIAQHHGGSWPLKHLREKRRYKPFFLFFWLAQSWENLVLKNIKVFYALSQQEIDYLTKRTDSKIKFQTMGIDEEYFKQESKIKARKKLNLQDKKILIFLGRISEEKGLKYLIDAMSMLPNAELKIIGYGEIEKFKNYAKVKKLKNVEFTGAIFGEKKMLYLSAGDALVLPSLKEGAPVTVMEALARNLPVVVSDVGGVRLMIEDNKEGIIIKQKSTKDIFEAVKKILKWRKNVKRYANKYKWKKIIDETIEDYKKI